ncbi:MAG: hypothetical protein CM1200mP34_0440 [Verrucomicrobiales bacterium]|nr:MAG: hypothetical protein CM1200mP34_0440 [Verrucomicrobiales bacterium]
MSNATQKQSAALAALLALGLRLAKRNARRLMSMSSTPARSRPSL